MVPAVEKIHGRPRTAPAGQLWRQLADRVWALGCHMGMGHVTVVQQMYRAIFRIYPNTREMQVPTQWGWWRLDCPSAR